MANIEVGNIARGRARVQCGTGVPTLVIGSIGTSAPDDKISSEIAKAKRAAELGVAAVTDCSFYGNIDELQRSIADEIDILLATVACYEFAARSPKREWKASSSQRLLDTLAAQVARGVDIITIHASVLNEDVAHLDENHRLIPSTSKGGGIVANYMRTTGRENPYYERFDDVLKIFSDTGAVISLGTTFRAATVCDKWDQLMVRELEHMGELAKRAGAAGVPIMIEGFGHAALDAIPTYINLARFYCGDVPYRVLPVATDRALGYDHIASAIAAAVAVSSGANAVTAMSRAEHIGLPTMEDLEEAIIATKIAVACGELTTLRNYSAEGQMSRTRWAQGCKGDWTAAIHPSGAEEALEARGRLADQRIQCSMCGDFCGIKSGIAMVRLGKRALSGGEPLT